MPSSSSFFTTPQFGVIVQFRGYVVVMYNSTTYEQNVNDHQKFRVRVMLALGYSMVAAYIQRNP